MHVRLRCGCSVTLQTTLTRSTAYLGEWIRAAAGTVVRLECLRRDDPMAPADVGEVHL